MKINITILTVIALLISITTPACSSESDSQDVPASSLQTTAEATGVSWVGYDKGMALGKKNGKKILLHFYADWCGYCKKMDKEIFSQGDAADFINQNFVPIRVNSDKEQQLAQAYRVTSLPSTWFLDKNGEGIQNITGYYPKEMFLPYLKFIATDSYQSMSFRKFMGVE